MPSTVDLKLCKEEHYAKLCIWYATDYCWLILLSTLSDVYCLLSLQEELGLSDINVSIHLAWISGHIGICANKTADELAKQTAQDVVHGRIIAPSHISMQGALHLSSEIAYNSWQQKWERDSSGFYTRLLLPQVLYQGYISKWSWYRRPACPIAEQGRIWGGGVTGSTVPRNVNIFWNFFNKYCVNFVICALRCITKRRNCCHQIRFWAASWYWGKGPPKGGRKGRGGKRKGEEGRGGWGKGKGGEGLSPNENPCYE